MALHTAILKIKRRPKQQRVYLPRLLRRFLPYRHGQSRITLYIFELMLQPIAPWICNSTLLRSTDDYDFTSLSNVSEMPSSFPLPICIILHLLDDSIECQR